MFDLKKLFGENLKQIRKRKGLTQEKLAELIGMDTRNLCKMENGNHFPQAKNLEKIIEVLDINIIELFDFQDDTESNLKQKIFYYVDKLNLKELKLLYDFVKILSYKN